MSKRVLIVDDEACFRNILEYSLEKAGYVVSMAVDGQKAMELLRKEKPHIMLLDINMPIMDGHEVCRLVRSDDYLKDLPIILITVMDEDLVAEKIKNKLANDYMIKPVEIEVLFDKMNNLIGPIA